MLFMSNKKDASAQSQQQAVLNATNGDEMFVTRCSLRFPPQIFKVSKLKFILRLNKQFN